MKTLEQVQAEEKIGDVFTVEHFCELMDDGYITDYDGWGFFHDGEKIRREYSVFDNSYSWDDVKDFPYIVWFNK